MRKAVILAMSAPLIIGPASAALAAVGGTAPAAPTSPTNSLQQAVQPAGSTGSTAPSSTTSQQTTQNTTTPAPPASSEAKPLDVAGIVSIGHTKAGAGPNGSSATGNAIELGGQVVSGGTATSGGKQGSGSLFDSSTTPLAPLGLIQIAPWTASATQTGDSSSADATASLAHVVLGGGQAPGFVDLLLFGSESKAAYSPAEATSSSVSDGVLLQVGQTGQPPALTVDLLHAETSSDKKGSSYLASINGNEIGSSDQVNGQCQIPIPSLLTINCLTATGGTAGQLASSAVGTVDFVPSQLPDATVSGTTSQANTVAAVTPAVSGEGVGAGSNGGTSVEGNKTVAGSGLPFTGLNAGELAALGGALAAGGMVALSLGRRRRTQG
jgi:hypothetical protein